LEYLQKINQRGDFMLTEIDKLQRQSGIIGSSTGIRRILEMILQVASIDISVFVSGESGSGKEVVAKAIQKASKRSHKPMVVVNCGAIPEGIIESELFGHKKGSFTGAMDNRKGYFEEANLGTIFLDEIGETPLEIQVKLLRVLESGEYMRVGEAQTRYTDVRIIAATNKNLEDLVRKGIFREDLYYRLKTVSIDIPALRDRKEDINLLVERFALEFTRSNDLVYRGFVPDAIRKLKQYSWPGNVRELKNFIEKILVLEKGQRIDSKMIEKQLVGNFINEKENIALPVLVNKNTDKAEIDLILRQLFLLKQDTEIIQKLIIGDSKTAVLGNSFPIMGSVSPKIDIPEKSMEITEDGQRLIRDDAIGDMRISNLEEEAIRRTLRFFNHNRRKTAKSLGMSERTLYRKIEEFGIEPKIKRSV
tara:strand:- start:105153 stop:106412 length:1260 start_codon:yes stop_codon:yes gene_type:complete